MYEKGDFDAKYTKSLVKKSLQKAGIESVFTKGTKSESIKESKMRRFTVKEVQKWMKTLEENRYKRTYISDCRRVAWLANNNLSEDYESMPKSMRKKWSKAQYGRERYLAKEFLKSKLSNLKEQLKEQKLRKFIRTRLEEKKKGKLNEAKETIFDVAARVMKDKQMYIYKSSRGKVKVDMQTANLLTQVFKKVNPKMKKYLSALGDQDPAQMVQTLWAVVK
jgi:hypothetical protein